jgi:uncharacterized glyoxalase superfamily protein PhnB
MSAPLPTLSLVTLGVSDLARAVRFYEALGFQRKARNAEGVGFFQAGACAFAVWPAAELAMDCNMPVDAPEFRGVALAWNCPTQAQVDSVMTRAGAAGATIRKPAQKTFWGGYVGYFTDPDGHLWEVAHNPGFPLTADGRLIIPD